MDLIGAAMGQVGEDGMTESNQSVMPGELPADDLIEIRDPEIDAAAIMATVRDRIQQRRKELGYEPRKFPTFGGAQFPGRPEDLPYDPDYYDHLELANELYLQVETEADLQVSSATRTPGLGRIWSSVREQAHALVLFYVNRSISHQTGVNREIIGVLNKLTEINVEQQRKLARLEKELQELRAELDAQQE